MADAFSMVDLVCVFMKTYLVALLQDNCLDLVHCAFLRQVVYICEEYNSILSTPTKADLINLLANTNISVKPTYHPNILARLIYQLSLIHTYRLQNIHVV